MMFNNKIQGENLLGCSYSGANILFHEDLLLSAVLNRIRVVDLHKNTTHLLGLEMENNIAHMCMDPKGVVLVVIDLAGYGLVWNIKGEFSVGEFHFPGLVRCVTWSQEGKLLAVGIGRGFYLYEAPPCWRSFQPFLLLKKHTTRHSADIITAHFSPDSRFLITTGHDNTIFITNLFPLPNYSPFTLETHRYKILGCFSSPDMHTLYSIDAGSNVFVWKWVTELTENYQKWREMKKRKTDKKQSVKKEIKVEEQQAEEEEETEDYSEFQKEVRQGRYILHAKHTITQSGAYLKRVLYRGENGFLLAAYTNGSFAIYKLFPDQITAIQSFSIGNYKISSVALNPSSTWIGLGIKEAGQLIVWEWKSQSYILNQRGLPHINTALAYNGGKFLATGTQEGEVKLWQMSSGFCVSTFKEHEAAVTAVKFSNQTTLFSCGLDGQVLAYDANKYRMFRRFKPDTQCQLHTLAIDESGDIIFASSFDPYEVYSWNVKTANLLQIIKGHEGPVGCIGMAGEYLLTGSWDRSLQLHQVYSRKLNTETLDHSSQITALAIHPSNKEAAVSTVKGQIFIWRIEEAELLGIINAQLEGGRSYFSKMTKNNEQNKPYLKTLCYSSCGKYLLGGGKSKYVMFYDVKNKMVLRKIEITKNRDLQGVVSHLNSKFIQNGVSTYEQMLEEQEKGFSDDENTSLKLPGSKKSDISEIRKNLEIQVHNIVLINSYSFGVNTSFGVMIYSSKMKNLALFNPYELLPDLTPKMVVELLKSKNYSGSLSAALKLGLPLDSLMKKIPLTNMTQTLDELGSASVQRLIDTLSQKFIDERTLHWIDCILTKHQVKIPTALRLNLSPMSQQQHILNRISSIIQITQLMHP